MVIALGAGALAAPLGLFAQRPGKAWKIGILSPVSATFARSTTQYGATLDALREIGYIEGQNISIERRFAEGDYDRLPSLVADIVQLNVDLILSFRVSRATASTKRGVSSRKWPMIHPYLSPNELRQNTAMSPSCPRIVSGTQLHAASEAPQAARR